MKGEILDSSIDNKLLNDFRLNKVPLGLSIGCNLDEHIRFKVGTFNVILGHANVGKTYWILWYFLVIATKHNKRFLIFSSENTTAGIKRNLIQLYTQKKITELDETEFYNAKSFIDAYFKFIDIDHLYSYKDLIKCFKENLDEFDCCLIDPYNSLIRAEGMGGNQHEIDYQVATEFRIFCRTNQKTLYVAAHAATEALRKVYNKEHELAGFPIPPNASDIEGGGKWVNRADDFIVIHRLTQHPQRWMLTDIHVKKIKETETGGSPTFMDEPVSFRLYHSTKFLCEHNGVETDVLNDKMHVDNKLPINTDFDDGVPF